jgi:hypothetical protein
MRVWAACAWWNRRCHAGKCLARAGLCFWPYSNAVSPERVVMAWSLDHGLAAHGVVWPSTPIDDSDYSDEALR